MLELAMALAMLAVHLVAAAAVVVTLLVMALAPAIVHELALLRIQVLALALARVMLAVHMVAAARLARVASRPEVATVDRVEIMIHRRH